MAAGIESRLWEMDDMVRLVEAYEREPRHRDRRRRFSSPSLPSR